MKPNNPFIISGYRGAEYFCGNEAVCGSMLKALRGGRNMVVISPRKAGRTGLIRHIYSQFKGGNQNIITVYMNIGPSKNLWDFTRIFAGAIYDALDTTGKESLEASLRYVRSGRTDTYSEEEIITEIFAYFQTSRKRFYIAIDEFQKISEYPEKDVDEMLHSLTRLTSNFNFIYAGSERQALEALFLPVNKPLFQTAQIFHIENIDRDAYYAFAAGFFAGQDRELSEEVFNTIYDRYDGRVWYIQRILNKLWGYSGDIDNEAIDQAVDEIIAENSYAYESILTAYSSGNVLLLKAIGREGCVREVLKGEFVSKYGLKAASSVNSAVKKLMANGLVMKEAKGYMIQDRFMGEWLSKL